MPPSAHQLSCLDGHVPITTGALRMDFGLLAFLPQLFLMVALMAWALAFWGLLLDQLRRLGLLRAHRAAVPTPL